MIADGVPAAVADVERRAIAAAESVGRPVGAVKLRYSALQSFTHQAALMLVGVNAAGDEANHAREHEARQRADYWAYLDESWNAPPGADHRQRRIQASALAFLGEDLQQMVSLARGNVSPIAALESRLRSIPAIQLWPFRSKDRPELKEKWPTLYRDGPRLSLEVIEAVEPRVIMSLGAPPFEFLAKSLRPLEASRAVGKVVARKMAYHNGEIGLLVRVPHPSLGS
jgi:hypothetical protein